MRWLCIAALLAAGAAHADLYRWIDPQSGSVKYSNVPPAWFGDPERERRAPAVQVIPSQRSAPAKTNAEAGAPARTDPAKPSSPASAAASELQSRWRDLLEDLTSLGKGDFERGGAGVRQQMEAYEAVRAELDRADPAGAARRRSEDRSILDQVRKGLAAQFSTQPVVQKK